jgi:hypothetical protein
MVGAAPAKFTHVDAGVFDARPLLVPSDQSTYTSVR